MVRKGKRSVANKIRKSNSDVRYDKMKHVSDTVHDLAIIIIISISMVIVVVVTSRWLSLW